MRAAITTASALDDELEGYRAQPRSTARRTSTSAKAGSFEPVIRVTIASSNLPLRATFNPVSVERDRRTSQLNQMVRLGYRPAKSSTK